MSLGRQSCQMRRAEQHVMAAARRSFCGHKMAVLPAGACLGVDSLRVGLQIWMECMVERGQNVQVLPSLSDCLLPVRCFRSCVPAMLAVCSVRDGHTPVLNIVLSCSSLCPAVLDLC